MKPVSSNYIALLLAKKPILIFNEGCTGLSFLERFVRRSPALVTSKECHKSLPLELWELILRFAASNPRKDLHHLVRPKRLHIDDDNETIIVCERLQQQEACGSMWECLSDFNRYLCDPERTERSEEDISFKLPEPTGQTIMIKIPKTGNPPSCAVLFFEISIPDVISWVEKGMCDFCDGSRVICSGCSEGREFIDNWICIPKVGCGAQLLCPLCIGPSYAEESLFQHGPDYRGYSEDEVMTDEEFEKWTSETLAQFGYS